MEMIGVHTKFILSYPKLVSRRLSSVKQTNTITTTCVSRIQRRPNIFHLLYLLFDQYFFHISPCLLLIYYTYDVDFTATVETWR